MERESRVIVGKAEAEKETWWNKVKVIIIIKVCTKSPSLFCLP